MDNSKIAQYGDFQGTKTGDGTEIITGFVLWNGIVEDIADPLLMNRVRVRAIGFHNSDRVKMPTNTLPWAASLLPSTGATSTSKLRRGDWVTGYFLDAFEAQKPVILGKINGINRVNFSEEVDPLLLGPTANTSRAPSTFSEFFFAQSAASSKAFATYPLTPEQLKAFQHQPRTAAAIITAQPDRPDTPRLSQFLVGGTPVGEANKNRVHVCDISRAMTLTALLARGALAELARGIRAAVKKILGLLGISLDSESARFIELAKKIKRGIDYIRSFIDKINNYAKFIVIYAQQVRAMIDWILSLPKSLAALLAECLNELLNSASAGFSTLVASSIGLEDNPLKDVAEIIDSSQKLINSTATLLNVPGQVVEALATPSTPQAQAAAANNILSFTSSFSTVKTPTTPTKP